MVKVSINRAAVEAKVKSAWENGLGKLSEEILNDCNQYCKEDQTTLIDSSLIHSVPKEGKLVWKTPYAKRQYWEIQTAHKDQNPQASWRWCEVAKAKHSKKWARQAEKYLKENLK